MPSPTVLVTRFPMTLLALQQCEGLVAGSRGSIDRFLPTGLSPLFRIKIFLTAKGKRCFKGALTYFLGCVAKEYVCGITWKFFATHRSFYNTALVINIKIEQ